MDKLDLLATAASERDADALRQAVANIDEDISFAPLLTQLLLEDWHDSHASIVFELGLIRDHGAVDAISRVVTIPFSYLVQQNNLHEFQRKCVYALARIGTIEARAALEDLAASKDPSLREYGKEGLAMWPLPYQRR